MSTPSLTVLVCRDCCCGTRRKHPDIDHDAHLEAIEQSVERSGEGRMHVTGCLDVCEHSNVVVVRWHDGARTETLWFGQVLHRRRLDALCAWLAAGGPRSGPPPSALALARFAPSARSAACAEQAAGMERSRLGRA